MKHLLSFIIGIISVCQMHAQNLESEMLYPDTLRSTQDSFFISSPKFDKVWSYIISKEDTLNLGTSGYKGVYMTIWTDLDTIVIPHVNFPYRQFIQIPIVSSTDTALCILRFQANGSNFDDEYALHAKSQFDIDIPEVYELANIILYLSQCSEKTGNRPNSAYAQRVNVFFEPFRNHKLIQVLNNNCSDNQFWRTYYGFRENSICFRFEENFLQYDTPYKQVFWDNSGIFGGQFRNILYLVQDFTTKSNFRKFYQENRSFYEKLIERQSQLLPINQMWKWLENEFPQRMDSYKIIFSPLIGGSHSTQKFQKGFFGEPEFQECIMFINSPENIESNKEYSEQIKEGLMSGIVFTEIDHNYVNPTSSENMAGIKELISDKGFWATKDAQQNYSSEYAIFNEYMTHSLFCLYVQEKYRREIRKEIIDNRIKLMERRGYKKFKQFNEILLKKMKDEKHSIYESYEKIIEAMKSIK